MQISDQRPATMTRLSWTSTKSDYMRDQDNYKSPNDVYSKDGRSAEYYLDTEKKRPLLLGEVPVSSQTNLRTHTGFNAFTSAM